ncbi:hypothetical protein AcW1_007288 [Taiwanofungus camphoratus]|nr:hypothetical protein AcW1_007288 [Antrodia cinnamomea]
MSFTQYFEEVAGAARAAPIAIMVSVAAVGSLGLVLLIAASFATVLVPTLLQTKLALPMGQLLLDVLGKRERSRSDEIFFARLKVEQQYPIREFLNLTDQVVFMGSTSTRDNDANLMKGSDG